MAVYGSYTGVSNGAVNGTLRIRLECSLIAASPTRAGFLYLTGLIVLSGVGTALAWSIVGDFEPGYPLFMIPMSVGNKVVGIIERADVQEDEWEVAPFCFLAFICQCGSTIPAKSSTHARRRIVNLAVTLCERDPFSFESRIGGDRCSGVPATAIAVTVPYSACLPDCLIPHITAHAAALGNSAFVIVASPVHVGDWMQSMGA